MNKKGTAILVTMVYLIIVAIICAAVLLFSHKHYGLITHRYERLRNIYCVEGCLYSGIIGDTGNFTIEPYANVAPGVELPKAFVNVTDYEEIDPDDGTLYHYLGFKTTYQDL